MVNGYLCAVCRLTFKWGILRTSELVRSTACRKQFHSTKTQAEQLISFSDIAISEIMKHY